jgi:hypothetical protein
MTTQKDLDALRGDMQFEFGCKFILEPGWVKGLHWRLFDATGHLLLSAPTKAALLRDMESFRTGMRYGMTEASLARSTAPVLKEIIAMAEAEVTDPAARLWGISRLARAALARLNGGAA